MSCVSRIRMYDNVSRLPMVKNWLCFEALADGACVRFVFGKNVYSNIAKSISYSRDFGNTWTTFLNQNSKSGDLFSPEIVLNKGKVVFFKGDATCLFGLQTTSIYLSDFCYFLTNTSDAANHYTWYGDTPGIFKVSGNIMSLLYGDDFEDKKIIPSDRCFESLFSVAIGITTAPELPAVALKNSCYEKMFQNCKHLTSTPDLPAEVLPTGAYKGMFQNCTNIKSIKAFCKTIGTDALNNWLSTNLSSNGVFYKNSQWNNYSRDENGIPAGWNIVNIASI